MTPKKFFKILFKPGEKTCFAESPYDTDLYLAHSAGCGPYWSADKSPKWFSINPLQKSRKDENVTAYRNFLIELDSVPIKEQIQLVTSVLPVTSIVFSGGKSYHFIISLQDDLPNETEYRRYAKALLEQVPQADASCKNPSRLSRFPGTIRPDTGLLQELIYLGESVPLSALPQPKPVQKTETQLGQSGLLSVHVAQQLQKVLELGVDDYVQGHFSGRNQFFYWLGRRLQELQLPQQKRKEVVDKFYDRMQNKRGFSKREAYSAARVRF